MSSENAPFHPFEGTVKGEYRPARRKLYRALGLRTETQEDWAVLNRDRDRAHEFADYYFSHPEMKGASERSARIWSSSRPSTSSSPSPSMNWSRHRTTLPRR